MLPPGSVGRLRSTPARDATKIDKSVLPPGTDHKALVDAIMAAVRYHHLLGRPHLQPKPAGLLDEDDEGPEAFWRAADAILAKVKVKRIRALIVASRKQRRVIRRIIVSSDESYDE